MEGIGEEANCFCDTFSSEFGMGDARLRTTACCLFSLLTPMRVVVGVFNLHDACRFSLHVYTLQCDAT